MGIYGALSSAVTGLRAQAHALENISGNIANSQTTGYKRIETDFVDLIPDAPIKRQVPGAVLAQSRGTNDIQGDIKTVSNETFIALNTGGFFVVEPKVGQSDGNAVFADTNFYTRRGDFEIDKDGRLVNGAGYYLKGLPIDPGTGNISGSVPEVLKLSNAFLAAQKTNAITYQANLPQLPKTTAYNATIPNSELLNTASYGGTAAAKSGALVSTPAGTTGNAFADDTLDADINGFAAGGTVSISNGTVTRTYEFIVPPGAATGTNQGIDVTTGRSIAQVLADIQTDLQANGMGTATIGVVGANLSVSLGAGDRANNLTIGGTAAGGLGLGTGPFSPSAVTTQEATAGGFVAGQTLSFQIGTEIKTIEFHNNTPGAVGVANLAVNIQPGTTVAAALAAMQTQLRSAGGNFSSATVGVDSTNHINVTLGNYKGAPLTISGTATGLGLAGTHNNVAPPDRMATISANSDAQFKANSVAGGAITVYASNGSPVNVITRWAKIDSAAQGGRDTWNLFYMSKGDATGTEPMWTNLGQDYTFTASGALETDVSSVVVDPLVVNGVSVGRVEIKHGVNGITQFNDVNGTVSTSALDQNGYGAGEFVSVAINDSGRVVATYSNGERIDMAQVVTAQFNAINQLKRLDGGVFSTTSESGEAILDMSGSGIIGGALEASNTDISDEFTKLIVTQQAYAAGTRIVSAADKMLQEALNMIR